MIDKELYRQAHELHNAWNEFDEAERIRKAGTLTPAEAWRQYVDLVEFIWRMVPEQSARERAEHLAALDLYYERVQRLEAWRKEQGKSS
ncbi:MAG: hypothetical protein K1X65_13780 [Caldilineales bacterium]|nr:hypothetical protein [Caldilineales bacterium]MCW5857881.1 hypothetical protein [Caldilineales bacterium]